jgi:hypothetical protein
MGNARTKSTPLSPSAKLTKEEGIPLLDDNKTMYSELVGSLMYLSVCTRPDITHAVGALARYMAYPTSVHMEAARGVLRYLAGTHDYGLIYNKTNTSQPLLGYCDADYAGDIDTRRSTTGYAFVVNGSAISWSSRLQHTVAVSTAEAEYMAAAAAVKEALWLRKLLADLGKPSLEPMEIKCDNQSAIKLLKHPIASVRSKHIDVVYHFARERVARKEVIFSYCSTGEMIADCLTKALPPQAYVRCRDGLGVLK